MLRVLPPLGDEGLPNRQGRAAVGETDLDDHPSLLCGDQVATRIAVLVRERHTLEVTVGPGVFRADLREPSPHVADSGQKSSVTWHRHSIAARRFTCRGARSRTCAPAVLVVCDREVDAWGVRGRVVGMRAID